MAALSRFVAGRRSARGRHTGSRNMQLPLRLTVYTACASSAFQRLALQRDCPCSLKATSLAANREVAPLTGAATPVAPAPFSRGDAGQSYSVSGAAPAHEA